MVNKNEIIANVSKSFNKKADVNISDAQSKLRDTLENYEKATRNAVTKLQLCSIALVKVVHSGAGNNGLDTVPEKKYLKELLKVQIEAICTIDGVKDEVKAKNIGASAEKIAEQAMLILKGDFIIGWSPKGDNVFFEGQLKKGFKPNPNTHEERVFRPSNVPFPKFKDNGVLRTNSPKDIVPVTSEMTTSAYKHYFLSVPLNNDRTGLEVNEREKPLKTVSNAKEALTATLGLMSWVKNQGFVDGQISADLWDSAELDNLVMNPLFLNLIELSKLLVEAKTVADAQMSEFCLKKTEAEENAKMVAEENLKFRKRLAEENPNSVKAKAQFKKALKEVEKLEAPEKLAVEEKKQIKKIANEILEAPEKNMKLAVEEKKQIKEIANEIKDLKNSNPFEKIANIRKK